jgi:hypothetical protein
MDKEPHLSGEQQRHILDLAARLGLDPQDVLDQALDFSRVRRKRHGDPRRIVGLFADQPELIDEVVAYAYRMRDQATLRVQPDA